MKLSLLAILVAFFLMLLIIHSSYSQLTYPDLVIEVTYTTQLTVEEETTLPVTITNKGETPATNITVAFIELEPETFNVTPFETEAPEVLSPSENMTGGFKLIPLKAGNFTIHIMLTYFDLHGKKYQNPANINVKVNPAPTSTFDNTIITIALLVIISGAVCMFYLVTRKERRRRSRKSRRESDNTR